MKIKVRFYSYIKSKTGKSCIDLDIPEDATIKTAINELRKIFGQSFISLLINKEKSGYNFVFKLNDQLVPYNRDDSILKDGDVLSIFSSVSGG
jgi:MoaD family protein